MNRQRKLSTFTLLIAYVYMTLPFLIFAVGWLRKRFWIPIVFIVIFSLVKMMLNQNDLWTPKLNRDTLLKLMLILLIIMIWVYYSGIGAYVFQNEDHYTRNSIFELLVAYDWPIINDTITNAELNATHTSLIYYIGFWMPASLVGKRWGLEAGYLFQYVWAVLGIMLTYYFVCCYFRKIRIWPLFVFIFFSGLDIVGVRLTGQNLFELSNISHLEWWAMPYQYSSMTTQLFWVFNQAISAWLCTILMMLQKNAKSIIMLWSGTLFMATFPFVGLGFICIFICARRCIAQLRTGSDEKKSRTVLVFVKKELITFQNFWGGGVIGIVSFLYLKGNYTMGRIMKESSYGPCWNNNLLKYIMFILLEIGIYAILLYRYNRKTAYYMCLCMLLIIPIIHVGETGDFCMRTSIPFLFCLMLFIIDTLQKVYDKKDVLTLAGILLALCIGAATPIHEIARTFAYTILAVNEGTKPSCEAMDSVELLNTKHLIGNADEGFFYQYLIRRDRPVK